MPHQLSLDYDGVNKYWLPMLVTAQVFYRTKQRTRAKIAAGRCKKQTGKLQGEQLPLFLDPPSDPNFYRPPVMRNFSYPLIDIFPMAYSNGE